MFKFKSENWNKEMPLRDKALLGSMFLFQNLILIFFWIYHDTPQFYMELQTALPYDKLWLIMEILFLVSTLTYMLSIPLYIIRRFKRNV